MKGSVRLAEGGNSANVNTKMVNSKSPYKKEQNFDIVDQLRTRLLDIKHHKSSTPGMHLSPPDHTDAIQKYYAAFPALKKGEESPQQYYLPAPTWCRKTALDSRLTMQSDLKEFSPKTKKHTGKERRNSYHCQRKSNKRRGHNQSRSFESKECLPEWVTSEGVWDIETQDPIKEFIRAIALDEGYGTCENTVLDDITLTSKMDITVPDWQDSLRLEADWVIADDLKPRAPCDEELYAKFEAKFDRSIEALWSKGQATPDDEYQELPIDFHDLLASPSDKLLYEDKCSLVSLTESIWSNDGSLPGGPARDTPTCSVDRLHDRFKPLNLADVEDVFLDPYPLYADPAGPSEADVLRSLAAINHSDRSGFASVLPRRLPRMPAAVPCRAPAASTAVSEDLLTSSTTHFRPIRVEARVAEESRAHVDGATFTIDGALEEATYRQSASGLLRLEGDAAPARRYLEYRAHRAVDYRRLDLCDKTMTDGLPDPEFRLRFALRATDKGVQTEPDARLAWRACGDCGRAKKMRPDGESIWSGGDRCGVCAGPGPAPPAAPADPHDWEELLADISAAHAQYANEAELLLQREVELVSAGADRKRRHSAARTTPRAPPRRPPPPPRCHHPHAPFLHCAGAHRPLTR